MSTAAAMRAFRGPALFSFGFRPFFFFGAVWAALATPIWLVAFTQGGALADLGIDLAWHTHEMIFGFVGAIIAGFLLTAVPNWTGRLPVVGPPLAALFGLWLAGRVGMFLAPSLGGWTLAFDLLFLVTFSGLIWREVLAGRNWRNLPVAMMVSLFAAAAAGHTLGGDSGLDLFMRAGLAAVAMMLALIGGRITPSFTRNWQLKRQGPLPATAGGEFDRLVLMATSFALIVWTVQPSGPVASAALLIASLLNLLRLGRWRGWRTTAEPLVAILHVGYLWLPIALGLLGLAAGPWPEFQTAGVHALTAGAMGVMILAVMTRASRGHTGRPLTAGWGTVIIYALVNIAALARVMAGLWPEHMVPALIVATSAWSAAFGGFALAYGPMLLRPRAT